jgi:hypothetical protein
MPRHDMSHDEALALVHQEDGFEVPGERQLENRPIRPQGTSLESAKGSGH